MDSEQLLTQESVLAQHPAAGQGQEANPTAPQAEPDPIEKEKQRQLVDLVRKFERESDTVRRHHVRRFLKSEEMWKGNQHIIWSERQFKWRTPFEWGMDNGKQVNDLPKYQSVTNFYLSFGLSIIAAISQKLPKVRFSPKSAKNERDIATAKAASDVAELIEDNNNLDMLSVRYAYLMWTQGIFGAYIRYVLDEEFGKQQVPQVEMKPVQVAPDRFTCQQCGNETPADQMAQPGIAGAQELACADCQYPLTDMDFQPAEMGEGPVITGTIDFPNGQEVITVYGGLNLKLMPNANTQKESAYLILVEDMHVSAVRAAHPTKAKEIGHGGSGAGSAENKFEQTARLALADSTGSKQQPGAMATTMVAYTRAWLRNWALWTIEDDDIRTQLLADYPDGVMITLADDTFLEARNENLDDSWEVCTPMPGQGMYRQAVGDSTIPIQERYNTAANVQAEHIEFGSAPPVFFDARYINREALEKRRMQPANFFPIVTEGAPAGTDITKLMYQPQMKIDSNIYSYGKELTEVGQWISGAMPTIFGGELKGNETASAYSMSRSQSLGKLGLFWRSVKQFHARLMLKGVECFRKNRTDDIEHVIFGKSGAYTSKFIHLEDLKGNITAKPESDEDFPATWAEIRENIIALIQQVPEFAQKILSHPANAPMLRKFIANNDIVFPLEDDREKQYREIYDMLDQQPVPDPMTGQLECSLQPEPFVDDHEGHILTAKEWAVSDEGLDAKASNPAGYANVLLHIVAHYKARAEAEAAVQGINAAAAQMLPQPVGSPDGAAPSGSPDTPQGDAGPTLGDKIEQAAPGVGAMAQKVLKMNA